MTIYRLLWISEEKLQFSIIMLKLHAEIDSPHNI